LQVSQKIKVYFWDVFSPRGQNFKKLDSDKPKKV